MANKCFILRLINWIINYKNYCTFIQQLFFYFSFVAPKDGLYITSASVTLAEASAKSSTFLMTIVVSGDPSSFKIQNGMQDYIENNKDEPYQR